MNTELNNNNIQTAERLASSHSIEELSNTLNVLTTLSDGNEKIHPDLQILIKAVQLLTNEVFYIFSGTDELASELGDGDDKGVMIYHRIGNKLSSNHFNLYPIETALDILENKNCLEILTGDIDENFLGIESETDIEHDDSYVKITRSILDKQSISFLRDNNIKVKVLSILV